MDSSFSSSFRHNYNTGIRMKKKNIEDRGEKKKEERRQRKKKKRKKKKRKIKKDNLRSWRYNWPSTD